MVPVAARRTANRRLVLDHRGRPWHVHNAARTGATTSIRFRTWFLSRASALGARGNCHKPAWIRIINRVIRSKCIRIGCRRGARDEKRVAAQEAADGWIVEAGAQLGDAEGGEGVAVVPLLVAVERASRLGSGGGGGC